MALPKPQPRPAADTLAYLAEIRAGNNALEQDIRAGLEDMVGQLQNAEGGDFMWAMQCSEVLAELRA